MNENVITPKIPFVWNSPDIIKGESIYKTPPLKHFAKETKIILGAIYELNSTGVSFLEEIFSESKDRKGKFIVFLAGAGQTKSEDLERLLKLKQQTSEQFDIKVWALRPGSENPTNAICCFNDEKSESLLFTGSLSNFNSFEESSFPPPIVNLGFRCDASLQKSFFEWFDYLWERSTTLTEKTARIPALVPARGTPEASLMWEEYLAQCQVEIAEEEKEANNDDKPKSEPSATEQLGIPKVDNTAERMARLFDTGSQVTIDKTTRIPPLDAPIKPEWFGVESLRQVGAVKRTIQYRISVITPDVLKQLDNKRKKASDLLKRLSFPLGDGVHWMPEKAFSLFEQEMNRVNEEGQQQLKSVLGKDTDEFVDSQRAKILKDANAMLQDFQPGGQLSQEHSDDLINDLKSRLKKASEGKFLPKVSRVNVSFKIGKDSEWESAWGQALTFLQAIAEFPRKAMTDRYFLQGLRVDEHKLIQAMNVANDYLASDDLKINPRRQAENDLEFLDRLIESDYEPREKCSAIFYLLIGKEEEEIYNLLEKAKKEEIPIEQKAETIEEPVNTIQQSLIY